MDHEIKNKVAVITGGAKGIGYAIAEEILKEGAKHVVLLDVNSDQGFKAARILNSKYGECKAEFITSDVITDLNETFNVIIDKYKTVDILVNNAGIADEMNIKRILDINTKAVIEWSTKFLGHMRKDKGGIGGAILNMSSIAGYALETFFVPVYTATKFAVLGFSKAIGCAENYEVHGVRVVTLCPGLTNTDLVQEFVPHKDLTFVNSNFISSKVEMLERQEPKNVATAAVEVIKNAASGSAWSIIGAKPIKEV